MLLMTETCPNCGDELTSDNAAGGLCGRCLFERGIEFTSTMAIADGSTPGSPRFTAPDPVEVEADLFSFDVLELIGQGGMGAVYKAYQRNLDRTVAIKILPRQSSGGHEFAERFAREARALARLRHEHIVMAYDYGLTDRYLYSVMEYVGGPNLRELLRGAGNPLSPVGRGWERGEAIEQFNDVDVAPLHPLPNPLPKGEGAKSLPPRRALEIARDICAALQYAHDHGVVHRDIKPENMLLDENGRVKIADFGLAKLLQPDPRALALTHTRHFMGTLHYMAPEQCERPHETDHRADIYSLGVVLYEMLTGELPIGRFDPPSMRADVEHRIDDVVHRALEKDPARRYATAAEFGEAIERELDAVAAGLGPVRNSSPLRGEAGRGVKHDLTVMPSHATAPTRIPRGPLVAAGFLAFLALAYFGWQFLLKYQRDKDGNTTLTVEAKGGDDQSTSRASGTARAADDKSRRKTTAASDDAADGQMGPVQIELFDGGAQIVLRGDPKDVKRVEQWIAHREKELFGRLGQGAKTNGKADATKVILNARIFQLRSAQASDVVALLKKVFANTASQIEADIVSNSIVAMAEHDTMTTIAELLVILDRAVPQAQQADVGSGKSLPALEGQAKEIKLQIDRVTADIEAKKRALAKLDEATADDAVKTNVDVEKTQIRGDLESLNAQLRSLAAQLSIANLDEERHKARIDALDRGDYPHALLMDEIKDDPRLVELQQKINDIQDLYEHARSVAKYPTDPAVLRYAQRLKTLNEAEEKLIADLLEVVRLKLRWGTGPSRQTKGIVQGTQTSPGGQTKIFSLQNTLATEAYEMLRKLYPDDAVRMTVHNSSNRLVVEGDPETLAKIEAILLRLDESAAPKDGKRDGPKGQIKVFPLRNSKASEAMKSLQPLLPDGALRIAVDDRSNSLIVQGDPQQLDQIEATLRQLGEGGESQPRRGPVKVQSGDALRISVAGTVADAPIDGVYTIDPDGFVNLGAVYGKLKVSGMTADEAQAAVLAELRKTLRSPQVTITIENVDRREAKDDARTVIQDGFKMKVAPGAPKEYVRFPKGLMKPFTAIHWEKDRPQVEIEGRWYELAAIENLSIDKILEFAKKTYPTSYQEKVENDLESLLKLLDQKTLDNLQIRLRRLDNGQLELIDVRRSADGAKIVGRSPVEEKPPEKKSEEAEKK